MHSQASREALEKRIEELQRELRRTSRFEEINRVLLGISETVCRATALDEFFASIRSVLSSVIDTSNFSIALYDADQDSLSFPYCVVMTSVAGQIALAIERKRREKELEQSMAHLQSIFRAAPVGIGVTVDRVMVKASQRLCEITDYAREELIDRSARMLYLDDADFDHVGRVKYMQIRDHDTGTVETRWRRKDGAVIDVLLSSTPLDVRDLGKGVTFTALDITTRKQVEAERERLRVAIEQAAEIIVITDQADRAVSACPENGSSRPSHRWRRP